MTLASAQDKDPEVSDREAAESGDPILRYRLPNLPPRPWARGKSSDALRRIMHEMKVKL